MRPSPAVWLVSLSLLIGCGGGTAKLSDAEVVWCGSNAAKVGSVGRQLGLALPKGAIVEIGSTTNSTDFFLALGVDPEAVWQAVEGDPDNLASVASAWKSDQPAGYERACRAAFESQ